MVGNQGNATGAGFMGSLTSLIVRDDRPLLSIGAKLRCKRRRRMFRRRRAEPQLIVSPSSLGKLGADQVPAKLRVAAATAPASDDRTDVVVISGLLLGPFPLEVVQLTVALARESWPVTGRELAAVADPKNPLVFALVLGRARVTGGRGDQDVRADTSVWDPGPGGSHYRAAAQFLADTGFIAEDFGPGMEAKAPGLPALLDRDAAQHMTVVTGQHSLQLRSTGVPTQGTVVQAQRLPLPAQMMPTPDALLARVTFDVIAPGTSGASDAQMSTPYRTTIRWGFRSGARFAELATPGTRLPLRVDPADRMQVAIDSAALPPAQQGGDA